MESKYICECPKCGVEIERVTVRRGHIRVIKLSKSARKMFRVNSIYKFRVIKHGQSSKLPDDKGE